MVLVDGCCGCGCGFFADNSVRETNATAKQIIYLSMAPEKGSLFLILRYTKNLCSSY